MFKKLNQYLSEISGYDKSIEANQRLKQDLLKEASEATRVQLECFDITTDSPNKEILLKKPTFRRTMSHKKFGKRK